MKVLLIDTSSDYLYVSFYDEETNKYIEEHLKGIFKSSFIKEKEKTLKVIIIIQKTLLV